jgi:hypothetical protein
MRIVSTFDCAHKLKATDGRERNWVQTEQKGRQRRGWVLYLWAWQVALNGLGLATCLLERMKSSSTGVEGGALGKQGLSLRWPNNMRESCSRGGD